MFEWHFRCAPVVLIYGARPFKVSEHTHGGRLMKELFAIAESGEPIKGVFDARRGVLAIPSVRALNCYLRHGIGSFNRAQTRVSSGIWHRYAWDDLCFLIHLQWS